MSSKDLATHKVWNVLGNHLFLSCKKSALWPLLYFTLTFHFGQHCSVRALTKSRLKSCLFHRRVLMVISVHDMLAVQKRGALACSCIVVTDVNVYCMPWWLVHPNVILPYLFEGVNWQHEGWYRWSWDMIKWHRNWGKRTFMKLVDCGNSGSQNRCDTLRSSFVGVSKAEIQVVAKPVKSSMPANSYNMGMWRWNIFGNTIYMWNTVSAEYCTHIQWLSVGPHKCLNNYCIDISNMD